VEYWKPLSVILVPPPALVILPEKSTPEVELFATETVEETVGAAQVGTGVIVPSIFKAFDPIRYQLPVFEENFTILKLTIVPAAKPCKAVTEDKDVVFVVPVDPEVDVVVQVPRET